MRPGMLLLRKKNPNSGRWTCSWNPDDEVEAEEDVRGQVSVKQDMEQYISDASEAKSGEQRRIPKTGIGCQTLPMRSSQRMSIGAHIFEGYIVHDDARNSLLPANVDKLVFFARNMKRGRRRPFV